MQWRTLLTVTLVVVASLAGASGPVGAQSQSESELVTLTVELVVPSSNQRVGGAELVARWDGGQTTATTASNGRAFLDVPEAATVEITIGDSDYTRNEPYRIRVATEREHTIEVARKAELDVVVRDAEGPVGDARVVLRQDDLAVATGRTDSSGRFQSGTVAQGRYTLSVVRPGYYRTTTDIVVAGSPEQTVNIESGRVDYDIAVEDPHFDPAQPVANATVSIEGVGNRTTDERGAVGTLVPVNSDVRVRVSKAGYGTVTETITVNESEGSASFSLSREPSLSLTTLNERVVVGEVVAVEVTNAYGEPAGGVALLLDGERVGQTDSGGEAAVRIEEAGDHELRARRGEATSTAVTVRGVGEGSTGAAETDADVVTTGVDTAAPAGDGGFGLRSLAPFAVLAALGVVLALVLLRRRRGQDEWTEGGTDDEWTEGGVDEEWTEGGEDE
ncbi:carboxypeptidase-like regulatory domain-containing protein [Salinigranum marinum]|uniref:carboxypeptidase-like regulatory domain-containing protein n=1 Tax=Salinigranum marinum TaxID=1515595 RepID=UPI002989BBD8|nr:carboxypeptidase-like regulatory domain-containing protein [Salinigranum marinum]